MMMMILISQYVYWLPLFMVFVVLYHMIDPNKKKLMFIYPLLSFVLYVYMTKKNIQTNLLIIFLFNCYKVRYYISYYNKYKLHLASMPYCQGH